VGKSRPLVHIAKDVDESLSSRDHAEALLRFEGRWIETSRLAFGWVDRELAKKLNVSHQSVAQLEKRERDGAVTIRKLKEIAGAMNCRLVYGFIPAQPMAETAADLERRQEEARRRHRKMPRPS
jgi:transcriptional regulator with XRE-family HTH domain